MQGAPRLLRHQRVGPDSPRSPARPALRSVPFASQPTCGAVSGRTSPSSGPHRTAMENPEKDLFGAARALVQGSREDQERFIDRVYLPDSSFSHPFVDCKGRDEILDAYDYWVHSHRKIDFTYKDTKFNEDRGFLLIFDFTARFWPYYWPFQRPAYALHYDIEVDVRKAPSGKWWVARQDDTLRLLDTTREVPVLGDIIGDESSLVRRTATKLVVWYVRLRKSLFFESQQQKVET